jgi:hypothetical protein
MEGKLRFQCCFCGLAIESVAPDVGSLLYTTCIDQAPNLHQNQELYCHTKCLRERLHPSAKLYALDLLALSAEEASSDGARGDGQDEFAL